MRAGDVPVCYLGTAMPRRKDTDSVLGQIIVLLASKGYKIHILSIWRF